MKWLAFSTALLVAFCGVQSARAENCFHVKATADARNPQISTERAQKLLQEHIVARVSSMTGMHIGPVHTHCIRNACESSAVVCHQ